MSTLAQSRHPAGSPDGGQFSEGAGSESTFELSDASQMAADMFGPQGGDVVVLLDKVETLTDSQSLALYRAQSFRSGSLEGARDFTDAHRRMRDTAFMHGMAYQVWQLDETLDEMDPAPAKSVADALHAHLVRHLISVDDYELLTSGWRDVMGPLSSAERVA